MTFLIAHRGCCELHPENSLAAFAAALDHVGVVEVDVRCTSDGMPVCTHDSDLSRTHGMSKRVGQVTLAELRREAPEVPTLAEVLDLVGSRGGAAMLDVKVSRPRAIEAIERDLQGSLMQWNDGRQVRRGEPLDGGTATFQSGDSALLQAFRSRTGAGCIELAGGASTARELVLTAPFITTYAQGVTLPATISSRVVLGALRVVKLGSYVYTVNDQEHVDALGGLGASAVYTDAVDRLAPPGD